MRLKKISLIALIAFASSCAVEENENQFKIEKKDAEMAQPEIEIPQEVFYEILKSIPSPIETSALLQSIDAKYSESYLHDPDLAENYSTPGKQAINLGIYGADLGYVNMYEEMYTSISYLKVVKSLADELRIGQFFDFNTLKRMSSNRKNLDSLLYISQKGFEEMNGYLQEQKRGKISTLLLVGGWLEGVYIASQVNKNYPNEELFELIGEQKVALDEIIILVSAFKNDPSFKNLNDGFKELQEVYKEVKITYTYAEPTYKEVNGILVVEDNSSSTIEINEGQVAEITKIVEELRGKLTK